jgi:ABC-type bacteriocin/lantibiotic exporter with double-glycine peptidase domain
MKQNLPPLGFPSSLGSAYKPQQAVTDTGKPKIKPIRQRTQFSCVATSATMCLESFGYKLTEEQVDRFFIKAKPFVGASWDQIMACMQYFGLRTTLVVPSTVLQIKSWIEQGSPVIISWNPENKEWSHSSVVFDVVEDMGGKLKVFVADPNIVNPSQTVRVLDEDDFYAKWYSKGGNGVVMRRPAMRIEREIDAGGKQTMGRYIPTR